MLKYSDKYVTGAWTSFFYLPENWGKRLSSQSIPGQYILIAEWLVFPFQWNGYGAPTYSLVGPNPSLITENPQTTTSGD